MLGSPVPITQKTEKYVDCLHKRNRLSLNETMPLWQMSCGASLMTVAITKSLQYFLYLTFLLWHGHINPRHCIFQNNENNSHFGHIIMKKAEQKSDSNSCCIYKRCLKEKCTGVLCCLVNSEQPDLIGNTIKEMIDTTCSTNR